MSKRFHAWATRLAAASGSWVAFALAALSIGVWLASGPWLGFSDAWMLLVNTGTTVVTFLLVFVIQHTQVTNEKALHAKLDELIRSIEGADNRLIGLEEESE